MDTNRYALLIGITYPNTKMSLPGCDNDVTDIRRFLKKKGWSDESIHVLSDGKGDGAKLLKPTLENITEQFDKLLRWTWDNKDGEIFIHYSGHGSQMADDTWVFNPTTKTMKFDDSNTDVCFVSCDLKPIRYDFVQKIFSQIPKWFDVFCLIDACHSGNTMDLEYSCSLDNESCYEHTGAKNDIVANVVMLSGYCDEQTCVSRFSGKWYGAITFSFLMLAAHMERFCNRVDQATFLEYMQIMTTQFPQVPQLMSSRGEFDNLMCFKKNTFDFSQINDSELVQPPPKAQSMSQSHGANDKSLLMRIMDKILGWCR